MPLQSLDQINAGLFPELPPCSADSERPQSARQRQQRADWERQLARAYGYQINLARSADERAEIEAEYEAQLKAGPDYQRYRRGSDFRQAPRLSIDRNAIARMKMMLQCIRRGTWRGKQKGSHHGGVPHSAIEVFDALVMLTQKYGRVFPSLVGLAYLSTRSKQTVVNAIKVLEFYGFIVVHRRIKRIRTALGFKTVQDTNAYVIQEPRGLGLVAFERFKEKSESRNQAASRTDLYILKRNPPYPSPWRTPAGIFAGAG